jgi:N-acetylmuramic acid 6-phosphate etherase
MTYSNWMINVSMTNDKLRERGQHIVQEILGVKPDEALRLVVASGSNLKVAVIMGATGCTRQEAEDRLAQVDGNLRALISHLGSGRE